jgi:hypothetical protein
VVTGATKFPVVLHVQKGAQTQTDGFEVDLVAAWADRLVLASVKSFFGSRGVVASLVDGTTADVGHPPPRCNCGSTSVGSPDEVKVSTSNRSAHGAPPSTPAAARSRYTAFTMSSGSRR